MGDWRQLPENERRAWAQATASRVTVDRENRVIHVSGPCPTCSHDFEIDLTDEDRVAEATLLRSPAANGALSQINWDGDIEFLAMCYCDRPHHGRPAALKRGCGASGWLLDTP